MKSKKALPDEIKKKLKDIPEQRDVVGPQTEEQGVGEQDFRTVSEVFHNHLGGEEHLY